jgi:hypothetical protein
MSSMRTTRLAATSHIVRRVLSVTGEVVREQQALKRAFKKMPKPVPWDWAAPRMLPILSGPCLDLPGEPLIRAKSGIGPMVDFGIDLGGAFTYVDEIVAQRWECSSDQLMERALLNLQRRAGGLPRSCVASGVMSGHPIRIIQHRPSWASSLLLVPNELFRLVGDHDQIVVVPTTSCLISFPLDTPSQIVADVAIDFERGSRRPLLLDPFLTTDGRVSWGGVMDAEDDDDDFEDDLQEAMS